MSAFRCVVCSTDQLRELESYCKLPRVTSDTKPFPPGGRLIVCRKCGAIQKIPDAKWLDEIHQIYNQYALYALSDGSEQLIFSASGPVERSKRLIEFLVTKSALPAAGLLLDIGCGTGAALANFA